MSMKSLAIYLTLKHIYPETWTLGKGKGKGKIHCDNCDNIEKFFFRGKQMLILGCLDGSVA